MTDPASVPAPERTVPCPSCGQPSVFAPRNVYRPFCSARCKGVDLGAWANEEFRVPTEAPAEEELLDDPRLRQPLQ